MPRLVAATRSCSTAQTATARPFGAVLRDGEQIALKRSSSNRLTRFGEATVGARRDDRARHRRAAAVARPSACRAADHRHRQRRTSPRIDWEAALPSTVIQEAAARLTTADGQRRTLAVRSAACDVKRSPEPDKEPLMPDHPTRRRELHAIANCPATTPTGGSSQRERAVSCSASERDLSAGSTSSIARTRVHVVRHGDLGHQRYLTTTACTTTHVAARATCPCGAGPRAVATAERVDLMRFAWTTSSPVMRPMWS